MEREGEIMKKWVSMVSLMLVCALLLAGCKPSIEDKKSSFEPAAEGYIVPNYEAFETPASENGLDGTQVAFEGRVEDILTDEADDPEKAHNVLLVRTESGDWLLNLGQEKYYPRESLEYALETYGRDVQIYATYQGVAVAFGLPTVKLTGEQDHVYFVQVEEALDSKAFISLQPQPEVEKEEDFDPVVIAEEIFGDDVPYTITQNSPTSIWVDCTFPERGLEGEIEIKANIATIMALTTQITIDYTGFFTAALLRFYAPDGTQICMGTMMDLGSGLFLFTTLGTHGFEFYDAEYEAVYLEIVGG